MRHYTDCAVLRSKLSEKLRIEIVDRVQENPVLRDFLTLFELLYMKPAQVKSSRQKIKELVRSGTPADSSISGWILLHTACSLGDKDLVEILVLRVGPKGGNTCSRRSWKFTNGSTTFPSKGVSTVDIIGFPPPDIIALVCYHHQLFDLFKEDIIWELQHLPNLANILLVEGVHFSHEADTESLLNRHYFNTKDIGAPHFNITKVIQWLCNTLCLQQLQQRQALLEALFLGVITSHYKNEQTIEESVEFLLNSGYSVTENLNFTNELLPVPLLTPLLLKHGCEIQDSQTDEFGGTGCTIL